MRLHDVEKSDRYYAPFEFAKNQFKSLLTRKRCNLKKVTTYNEEKVVEGLINLTKNIYDAPSEFAIFYILILHLPALAA